MKSIGTCSIVISSCDAFEDVWEPFFYFFFKYWPDCPFPIYLLANQKSYPDKRVHTLQITPDGHWASNLIQALRQIKTPYLLYLQEDYLLKKTVDTIRIKRLLSLLEQTGGACLRLFPSPGPDQPYDTDRSAEVGIISRDAPYRVSLQAALWNKKNFLKLMRDGETGWDMEIKGTLRSQSLTEPFLSVKRGSEAKIIDPPLEYICTAVVKGRWIPEAVRACHTAGIQLNFSRRKVESRWYPLQRQVRRILSPLRYRLTVFSPRSRALLKARIAVAILLRQPLRLIVGAGGTTQSGWFSTDQSTLNLLNRADWSTLFSENSLDAMLAEHVWEHLSEQEGVKALKHCYHFLKPGGYVRIAVPDGYHPNQGYIEYVRPGGTGLGAKDHKSLYTHRSLSQTMKSVGFKTQLLEYFDDQGVFHSKPWKSQDGHIMRSAEHDDRNRPDQLSYTSLIIDGIK